MKIKLLAAHRKHSVPAQIFSIYHSIAVAQVIPFVGKVVIWEPLCHIPCWKPKWQEARVANSRLKDEPAETWDLLKMEPGWSGSREKVASMVGKQVRLGRAEMKRHSQGQSWGHTQQIRQEGEAELWSGTSQGHAQVVSKRQSPQVQAEVKQGIRQKTVPKASRISSGESRNTEYTETESCRSTSNP